MKASHLFDSEEKKTQRALWAKRGWIFIKTSTVLLLAVAGWAVVSALLKNSEKIIVRGSEMNFRNANWILLGIIIGSFWGIFADLFYHPELKWKKFWEIIRSIYALLFQFVFNFIGGFVGCVGIGLFMDRYSSGYFGVPELVLLAISLVGVSGKLSDIIFQIPGLMKKLAESGIIFKP